MAAALRLVTIPISHYCEKARWALEWAGLPYAEEAHLQVFHYLPAWRAGGGRTVPILVHPGGVLTDSADILRWADGQAPDERKLLPSDPVPERIADGRPYLVGACFSAADLTFAALCAPLLMTPGYGVPLPSLEELPGPFARAVAAFRHHPAGRFALDLYARHRHP